MRRFWSGSVVKNWNEGGHNSGYINDWAEGGIFFEEMRYAIKKLASNTIAIDKLIEEYFRELQRDSCERGGYVLEYGISAYTNADYPLYEIQYIYRDHYKKADSLSENAPAIGSLPVKLAMNRLMKLPPG